MVVKTLEIPQEDLLTEVTEGLSKSQKMLPSKLFYDEKGSRLFDMICELDEYYPTKTETKILSDNINEITSYIGDKCVLVELGSGSSVKIKLLLDHLKNLAAYVPVDISAEHLIKSNKLLNEEYPDLKIYPIAADYTRWFKLPDIKNECNTIGAFYPGSTIGNFTPEEAREFLGRIAKICGKGSGLLIGVDLQKDTNILNKAYNDSEGITAEFNLNILNHVNNQLGANFDLSKFKHQAFYNKKEGRIEMHLLSLAQQVVKLNVHSFSIGRYETILTEYSYKYTTESFAELVKDIYEVEKVWIDRNKLFSVQFLRVI
jgi:dimethylhistidine N-methyltransferase